MSALIFPPHRGVLDAAGGLCGDVVGARPAGRLNPAAGLSALRALLARPAASGLTRPTVHAEGLAGSLSRSFDAKPR